jgi:peroxiredoxin
MYDGPTTFCRLQASRLNEKIHECKKYDLLSMSIDCPYLLFRVTGLDLA